jgi:ankyrin repeat protein
MTKLVESSIMRWWTWRRLRLSKEFSRRLILLTTAIGGVLVIGSFSGGTEQYRTQFTAPLQKPKHEYMQLSRSSVLPIESTQVSERPDEPSSCNDCAASEENGVRRYSRFVGNGESVKPSAEMDIWGMLSTEIAKTPEERFASLRETDWGREYPDLLLAVIANSTVLTERFLSGGSNTEAKLPSDGTTALMQASKIGNSSIVQKLLSSGASVNTIDHDGWTPLMYASYGSKPEISSILLAAGANPSVVSREGKTALLLAATRGDSETVRLLIAHSVDVNAQDAYGRTPLMVAAAAKSSKAVNLLVDANAAVNIRNEGGQTALIMATTDDAEFMPGDAHCVRILLEKGAEVNVRDEDGWTALMGVAFYGDFPLAQLLLQHGAEVDVRDKAGRTPLNLAIQTGKMDIANLFRKAGALE